MSDTLTPRQARVLEYITAAMARHGRPPTRAEIAAALGFRSANAAEAHLKALARKGAIELVPGTSRGIRLREPAQTGEAGLPVVGRVAAGVPVLAEEHIEARYPVAADLFRSGVDYLLRVRGSSMQGAGILDGDLLAVRIAREAANGQIVVARIDDEVTVKRFRRHGHLVTLLAENPAFPPLEIDLREQEFVLEGLAVGVIRPTLEQRS